MAGLDNVAFDDIGRDFAGTSLSSLTTHHTRRQQ
jgi:hypothetical protein